MKINPIPHELDLAVSTLPRSKGLHLSEIYGDLYQDLEPNRYKRDSPMDLLRLEAGLSMEAILEEGLKRRLAERPGEFVSDEGIIISPDLIIFNGSTRLGEMKLTWLSSRAVPRGFANCLPPQFDKWFCQMKGYCHVLRIREARLYAFFVNGDYDRKKAFSPELLCWDIEFTQREVDENWAGLINHARYKKML